MRNATLVLLSGVLMAGCLRSGDNDGESDDQGIVLANRDTTVRPGDDLFRYVNGGWISKTVIPPDRGSWGTFNEVRERNSKIILEIFQHAIESREYIAGTDAQKVIDFYSLGMDSLSAEQSGMLPLKPWLDKIESIVNRLDLQDFLADEDKMKGDAFFNLNVSPDKKNSRRMAVYLGAGGIGLPERDYYLKGDARSKETREKYIQHIANLLSLSGWEPAKSKRSAERIFQIETMLAYAMLSKEDRRDPVKQYNPVAVSELSGYIPSLNWTRYFLGLGVKADSVIIQEPLFLREVEKVINYFSLDEVKYYLRWSLLRGAAPYLSHVFVVESFEFNSKFLLGVDRLPPRWKRVLEVSDRSMGDAIGRMYVAHSFPPEAKRKALEMVENIRYAFADRIKRLDWMSDSTKNRALKKLSAFNVKIGFPDKWKTYAGLVVEKVPGRSSYYGNILHALQYQGEEQFKTLGKPVDRTVWDITPQTVNAYYNPQFNEIVFPAGILQPPFYDYQIDAAVNYGGIGAAIGHEISHGFDDEGSQFDGEGNLRNWWGTEDLKKFKQKTAALAEQFSRYQPLPGLFVEGPFTSGENIGDLGGLNAAYDGLHRFFRQSNQRPVPVGGLTPDQRFFMSWATLWRTKYRDESLRAQVLTNGHAPAMYRANGPVSNMDAFYEAFGVKPGDKIYRVPRDRVSIW